MSEHTLPVWRPLLSADTTLEELSSLLAARRMGIVLVDAGSEDDKVPIVEPTMNNHETLWEALEQGIHNIEAERDEE